MTDQQYFFMMLVLILNALSIVMLGLSQHYHTKSVNALVVGVGQLIAEIGNFRAARKPGG